MNPKIKEVIVVEGLHDTQTIQRFFDADTIETGGSALGETVLKEIARAEKQRGVIVFTDPDAPGERIRRLISERVPGVKHAFLSRAQATEKGKIGIEHASEQAITQALSKVRSENVKQSVAIFSWTEYISMGFIGKPDSSQLRERVADELGIGFANGKRFYNRLQVLQISRDELVQALKRVRKE